MTNKYIYKKITYIMKNIGVKLVLVVLGFTMLQACGETEEERRAKEQARMDSLRMVQQQEIAAEMAKLEKENASDATTETKEEMKEETAGYSFVEDGQYAVQVGAFRSEDKAKGYISKWADRNYPSAYTVKIGEEEYGDVWFRVRVGFFGTKEDAAKLGEELAIEMNSGYWVSKVR
jgi:cell division septation protein DedD